MELIFGLLLFPTLLVIDASPTRAVILGVVLVALSIWSKRITPLVVSLFWFAYAYYESQVSSEWRWDVMFIYPALTVVTFFAFFSFGHWYFNARRIKKADAEKTGKKGSG
nr:hypothetical protein 2 [Saccharospirillaceae bacterium]